MRVSTRSNDPGYSANAQGVMVRLNGNPVAGWITADDEAGFVRCLVDGSKDEKVLRGKVEIVSAGSSPAAVQPARTQKPKFRR